MPAATADTLLFGQNTGEERDLLERLFLDQVSLLGHAHAGEAGAGEMASRAALAAAANAILTQSRRRVTVRAESVALLHARSIGRGRIDSAPLVSALTLPPAAISALDPKLQGLVALGLGAFALIASRWSEDDTATSLAARSISRALRHLAHPDNILVLERFPSFDGEPTTFFAELRKVRQALKGEDKANQPVKLFHEIEKKLRSGAAARHRTVQSGNRRIKASRRGGIVAPAGYVRVNAPTRPLDRPKGTDNGPDKLGQAAGGQKPLTIRPPPNRNPLPVFDSDGADAELGLVEDSLPSNEDASIARDEPDARYRPDDWRINPKGKSVGRELVTHSRELWQFRQTNALHAQLARRQFLPCEHRHLLAAETRFLARQLEARLLEQRPPQKASKSAPTAPASMAQAILALGLDRKTLLAITHPIATANSTFKWRPSGLEADPELPTLKLAPGDRRFVLPVARSYRFTLKEGVDAALACLQHDTAPLLDEDLLVRQELARLCQPLGRPVTQAMIAGALPAMIAHHGTDPAVTGWMLGQRPRDCPSMSYTRLPVDFLDTQAWLQQPARGRWTGQDRRLVSHKANR